MSYRRQAIVTADPGQEALVDSINAELKKIESGSQAPEVRGIQFEIRQAVPARYKEGDLYYGAAGVFGGAAGLYIRDGNSWRKL
jgi:hypothetical protein